MATRAGMIRRITYGTDLAAVLAFAGIGGLGRQFLAARGVEVLPWREGMALFIPFALLHLVPVLVYTFLIRRACLQAFRGESSRFSSYFLGLVAGAVLPEQPEEFSRLLYSVVAACLALLGTAGAFLLDAVLYTGPGGFAELVIMSLAMFPLTLAYGLMIGLMAIGIGGLVGAAVYRLVHLREGRGP